MILTLLRIDWLNLRRDYVALGLTFVLPIIFFSIFALIFGGMGGSSSGSSAASATKIIFVDLDQSDVSARLAMALDSQPALRVLSSPKPTEAEPEPSPYTREEALRLIRLGRCPAAVIIPSGFAQTFGNFMGGGLAVEVIHDPSNPIVLHTVSGLLQAAAMSAAPDILMEMGMEQFDAAGGSLTAKQRELIQTIKPMLRGLGGHSPDASKDAAAPSSPGISGLITVKATDAGAREDDPDSKPRSIVAYYAAGIGVMFLLFSMANGAGGSLLEEEERGTLERLLTSRVSMRLLLLGHWLFFALIGVAQLSLMFVWAAVVFDLDLWSAQHLLGFAAMTVATAGAASAFGLVLATLCKSRAQLGGTSTIVILIMSALGGSMVPRFVMPEFMNTTALFTFNGWALDGYLKIFWYEDPDASLGGALANLLPQVGMLVAMAAGFLGVARLLAKRWEAA